MIKPYLQLVRAPNGITAISNIIAASVIVTAGMVTPDILILMFASLCFYYGGMALNDCFDFKEDLQERSFRPLPSGDISIKSGWIIGFGLLGAGLIACYSFSDNHTVNLLTGVALCVSIILYNGFIKNGLIGSAMMACCRYINWFIGFLAASLIGGIFEPEQLLIALPIFFYIWGLTYISKQETKAEDRRALTLLTVLLLAATTNMFALIWLMPNYFSASPIIATLLAAGWTIWMLSQLIPVWNDFTPEAIQGLVMWMIIGVIPFDALMVAISGHYVWAIAILALLPPCRWMSKKLYMT